MPPAAEHLGKDPAPVPALGGRLSAISLFDLCQFLMLNRKTGSLTVRSGQAIAYFIFAEGQLLNATDEQLKAGEAVVLRAVQWSDGTFDFAPGPVPPERRIQASTENILLEAARKIDEMAAEAGGDEELPSAERAFREKQERASSLSEAFRSVVAAGDAALRGKGWREGLVHALAQRNAVRLTLGPGNRIVIVRVDGMEERTGIPMEDLRAWMDELAPAPRTPRSGPTVTGLHRTETSSGATLWARRLPSHEGDWVAVSAAVPAIPAWSDLGLPDSLFQELEAQGSGAILLQSSGGRGRAATIWPGCALLGAWLRQRATQNLDSVYVVEAYPRYDWGVLPGFAQSIDPARLGRPGSLERLCQAAETTLLAVVDLTPIVLADALALAADGVQVMFLASGSNPASWLRAAERKLALAGLPGRGLEEHLVAILSCRSGPAPTYLPLTCRLGVPPRRPATAGAPRI